VGQLDRQHPLAQCSKERLVLMAALEQAHQRQAHLLEQEEQGQEAVFQHQLPLDSLAAMEEHHYLHGSLADLETEVQSQATEALRQTSQPTSHCVLEEAVVEALVLQQTEEMEAMEACMEAVAVAVERLLMGLHSQAKAEMEHKASLS
jgi:squalene cyclase